MEKSQVALCAAYRSKENVTVTTELHLHLYLDLSMKFEHKLHDLREDMCTCSSNCLRGYK